MSAERGAAVASLVAGPVGEHQRARASALTPYRNRA